jgi:hypothetical protein
MSIIVKIIQDDNAESPRTFDNVGVMACWHRRYNLGDVQPKQDQAEWLKENAPKGSVVLPLYLYDHSGITMSTGRFSCPWDSGQVGYIVATPDAIRKNFMVKRITKAIRAKVEECLVSEVKVYDLFLTGNVWGYTIESVKDCESCGAKTHGDEKDVDDSCWGFFGDDLAFTGIKEHVDAKYHEALEAAWDKRFG